MINVEDRIPTPGQEGQVTITPATGDPITGALVMADNPAKQGTPWSHQTGKMLQADIRSYPVVQGVEVMAGDVVDIIKEEVIITDILLSSIEEGNTIILNESGKPVEFYVAKHNYESELNGSGRTLLVRKDVYDQRHWDDTNNNSWGPSAIRSWLNSNYKDLLDADVQEAMDVTKYRYTPGGSNWNVATRSEAVFLLSATELGRSNANANVEGSALPVASILKIAYQNGSATTQWTRSPNTNVTNHVWKLGPKGAIINDICVNANGSRPAFTLPSTFVVGQTEENVPLDGTYVTNTITPLANTKNVFRSYKTERFSVAKINSDYSVALFESTDSDVDFYVLDNEGKPAGGPVMFDSFYSNKTSVARLTDSKFVGAYSYTSTELIIGTLSGTEISLGEMLTLSGGTGSSNEVEVIPISETSFICIYTKPQLTACVCTVSGTTITKGSDVALSGNTSAAYISATRLPDDGGNRRVCVCYADAEDGAKAVLCTTSASNSISWGSPVNLYSDSLTRQISCVYDGEDVIAAFSNATNYVFVRTLSAETLAIKEQLSTGSQTGGYTVVLVPTEVGTVISFGAGAPNARMISKQAGTLSLGDPFSWNNALAQFVRGVEISRNKIMLIYTDNGNGNYGTSTILTIRGNQIAGGFENTSSQAIALTSASAGETCEVIFDGVAQLSGVTAGQEITSDGVYGYCPMDGWIWVKPWWDKTSVTGSYTGTGTYGESNKNELNLGFAPSCVIILSENDVGINVLLQNIGKYFYISYDNSRAYAVTTSKTSEGIQWYSDTYIHQSNASGWTYHYVAFK